MTTLPHRPEERDATDRQELLGKADVALDRAIVRLLAAQRQDRTGRSERRHRGQLRSLFVLLALAIAALTIFALLVRPAAGAFLALATFTLGLGAGLVSAAAASAVRSGDRGLLLRQVVKRLADVLIASVSVIALAPLLAAVALLLKLEAWSAPVLPHQVRVGLHGRPFTIRRFRTFIVHAEGGQPTRVGEFLQRTGLDELPVLLNVLAGDMSLVGPRPRQPADMIRGVTHVPTLKPGIVSLADVRDARTLEAAEEIDLEYEDNWTLMTDIYVLITALGQAVRTAAR